MVSEIAAWCEDRAKELGTEASRQFRLIVLIVIIGLVLLLVLPPLIGQIDFLTARFFGAAPPVESLENTEEAVQRLDEQVSKSQARLDTLKGDLQATRSRLDQHAEARSDLVDQAIPLLGRPLALWQTEFILDQPFIWNRIVRAPSGTLFAVGYVENDKGEDTMAIASKTRAEWSVLRPLDADGKTFQGSLSSMAFGEDGSWLAAGQEDGGDDGEGLLILRKGDGKAWTPSRPESASGNRRQGSVYAMAAAVDGSIIVAGSDEGGDDEEILILTSTDTISWTETSPRSADGARLGGSITALRAARDGTLFAAGYRGEFEDADVLILRSRDGKNWSSVSPESTSGQPISGEIYEMAVAPDGTLFAAGLEYPQGVERALFFESNDGNTWSPIRPAREDQSQLGGWLYAVEVMLDGTLIGVGIEVDNTRDRTMIISSKDHRTWTIVHPEGDDGRPIDGELLSLTRGSDGEIYAAGDSLLISEMGRLQETGSDTWPKSGSWAENPERVEQALNGILTIVKQEEVVYPLGTLDLRTAAEETLAAWSRDRESEARISALFDDASDALTQQKDTLEKVQDGTTLLARALTDSDELRRASRIATRIAVVALLIYLVQIVVNRYRYLQRMEGFYRARAQALRLMAAAPQADAALKDITITDLMLALSPDGIGFDKSADPPTQNMMNIFREALRREKTP